jgi:hypothetical protein
VRESAPGLELPEERWLAALLGNNASRAGTRDDGQHDKQDAPTWLNHGDRLQTDRKRRRPVLDCQMKLGPIDRNDPSYYTLRMAMGKRKRERQPSMWVTTTDLPTALSHPFYAQLNQLLRDHGFDDFAETQCATEIARPSARSGRADVWIPPALLTPERHCYSITACQSDGWMLSVTSKWLLGSLTSA